MEHKMGRIILILLFNILTVFCAFTNVSSQTFEYCASIENVTSFGLYTTVSTKFFEKDVFKTSDGNLEITFIGHATLMLNFGGKVIHVDPIGTYADYSQLPKADIILVTHDHPDHFDLKAIDLLHSEKTALLLTQACSTNVRGGIVMNNGDVKTIQGIKIEAVPAYNIISKRPDGTPYHLKSEGNGYVITFGDKRIYLAGDTENIPEMKELKGIDIAFLPVTWPYTMTPEMTAEVAKALKIKVLYPYHYGDTDINILVNLLIEQMEVPIRKLK
jgi:L-ascorbate metabolism protein UlaG (beta-lactamase superfamily)